MKNKKLLSTILSVAVAFGMTTIVPVQAADTVTKSELVYETVYKETFENIDLENVDSYVSVAGENTIKEAANGNKYLQSTKHTGSFAINAKALNEAKEITASDYVKIEYDILQSDTDGNKLSSGGFVESTSGGYTIAGASWGSGGNWTVLNGSGATVNVANGEWIHVCLEYNFANATVSATMTDEEGNVKKSVAKGTAINNAGGSVTDFGRLLLNGSSSQGVDGAYDNIVISYGTYVDIECEIAYEELIADDFSTDNITGTSYWNVGGQTVADGVLTVDDAVKTRAENNSTGANLYLDINALLSAKGITNASRIKFEVDVITDSTYKGSIYLWQDGASDRRSKFFKDSGTGFNWNSGWNGTKLADGTYRLSVEYNLEDNTVYGTLKQGENIIVDSGWISPITDWYKEAMKSLGGIAFGDYQAAGDGKYDNLKVSYGYYAPIVTKVSGVEILANGEVQAMSAVHPSADVIKIYFTAPIDTRYITAENFKINNGAVSWTDSYVMSDNCVVLSLTDALTLETAYMLDITDSVRDAKGAAILAYNTAFTTTSGKITGGDSEFVDKGQNEIVYTKVYEEDFENIDLENVDSYVTVAGENTIKEATNGNKYLQSTKHTGSFAINAKALNEAKEITASDYVKIEYDILQSDTDGNKLSSGGFVESTSGGYTIAGASWGSGGNWTVLNGSGATVNVANGEWIHVCLEYNFANATVSATMTDEEGNVKKSVAEGTAINNAGGSVTDFGRLLLNGSSSQGVDGAYDNVVISYGRAVPTKPELTAQNITIYTAMGDVAEDWNNVTPAVKTVAIDFERSMNTETISDETVYVTKKNNMAHIPTILSYADGVVFAKFTGSILEKGTYTIHVSGTVENSNNVSLGDYFEVDFTVTDGECVAKVSSVKIGANNVLDITDIEKGSNVTVNVEYSNATGKAQDLNVIFAAYKGDEMSYVQIFNAENISENITGMTYKPTFTAPDMTGVTEVQVMVWNDWDSMKPIAPVVEFN